MTEGDYAIECVEDHTRVDHLIIVELSEILDLSDASLIESEVVLLKAKCDILKHIVDNCDRELLMVAIQSAQKHSKQVDVAELDFAGLTEDFF